MYVSAAKRAAMWHTNFMTALFMRIYKRIHGWTGTGTARIVTHPSNTPYWIGPIRYGWLG